MDRGATIFIASLLLLVRNEIDVFLILFSCSYLDNTYGDLNGSKKNYRSAAFNRGYLCDCDDFAKLCRHAKKISGKVGAGIIMLAPLDPAFDSTSGNN